MEKLKKTLGEFGAWFVELLARIKNTKAWLAAAAFLRKWGKQLFCLAAVAAITAVIALGSLNRVDKWVQDSLFQRPGMTSTDIVIIGIDDDAMDMLGPYNTNYRLYVAKALETMAQDPEHLPAVVAVDVLYGGEADPEIDARLAQAAENLGCVVTASMAVFGENITWENGRAVSVDTNAILDYEKPFDALRAVTVQGHINAMTDLDGVLRHALLYVEPDGEKVYSMACQTAKTYLEKQGKALTLPPVNQTGHFYVPFSGNPGDYSDGWSLYMFQSYRKNMSSVWDNKIVLIGPYAAALQDAYFTSMNKGKPMFGVEIQANVIQSLIDGNFKTEAADPPQWIALFLICFAAMLLFLRIKTLAGAGVCGGLMALGVGVPMLLYRLGYVTHILWLPAAVLTLYLLSMAMHYIETAKEKHALALKMERLDAELTLATRIQSSSLPKEFPPFPDRKEFDIFASMTPAKEVGGDLFDFLMVDDDHLALVIGDVSGKGVPAALFMMVSKVLIHNAVMNELSPAKVLQLVNHQICANNPEDMFVTVWLGVLEISTGKLTAANAGHEYPAVKKAGEPFELLKDRHGLVIGGMDGVRYREYELQLEPGAKVFVYTDGVAEATNAKEELFGTERMIEALRAGEDGTPEEVLAAVSRSVQQFVETAPQFDDLTMLCLQYNGPRPSGGEETAPASGGESGEGPLPEPAN